MKLERPWNRSFSRDVASILLREGKARVVLIYFFSKKLISMVPEENVHERFCIAELVKEFSIKSF